MVGSVLSNRYELLENIGAGGMAIVYKARCRLLNRNVAVKILRPEFQEDEEFLKRFTIEAQAAASLSHPNVVSVYDVGKHGKLNYIVMECIEGITLKEYMHRKGTLSVNEAVDFTGQIASALEHAHQKGIIHRDIKPHNIIITNEGVLKVTDFGLARAVSASTNVAGASAIGSVHYASPEQARGGFTDERSDIYSLGIMMYEMFTGSLPFDGETPVAVAMKHLEEAPVPPMEKNEQITPEIQNMILRAMAKDTSERYPSVEALITDLRLLCGGETPQMHTDKFSTRKLPSLVQEEVVVKDRKKKRRKEDTVAVAAAIATAVVIISVLGVFAAKMMFPSGGKKVVVPSLLNMSISDAKQKNKKLDIVEKDTVYSSNIPEGFIIEQDTAEGTKVSVGTKIMVTVSRGTQKIELADYVNKKRETAEKELKLLGLVPQFSEEHSDEIEKGSIVRTNPNSGYTLRTGDTVMLVVSLGKSEVEVAVPSLYGYTEAEARKLLEDSELIPVVLEPRTSSHKKGTVIYQSVHAGSMASQGAAVEFAVSTGELEPAGPGENYSLILPLPEDKEKVSVQIMDGARTVFEGSYETSHSPVTVNFNAHLETGTVQIYIDNAYYMEKRLEKSEE